jgi:hypothetical protein
MSNNFECALEGDEAYAHTDAWEIGGISMQGVYASQEDRSFDNDGDDDVDETKESKAGPALGGWSFATQADVASAACVGGHHKVTANQSASTQATRKSPSRPMAAPVNNRQPGRHGSLPRRGGLRPGGSVRMMPGPMAGARRPTNVTAGESAKVVARVSVSRGDTSTATLLVAGQGAGRRNKQVAAKASSTIVGGNGQTAASIRSQQEAAKEQQETKTEHAEAKAEHVHTKTQSVETKTEQVETKIEQVEAKPEHIETKNEHGEDANCIQVVHNEATFCQKALKHDELESVREMNESRQHNEGKGEGDVELAKQCETIPLPNNQATLPVGVSLEDKLETSAAVVDAAAAVCMQTIGAHVLNYTHHKNVELWYSTDGWQTQQVKPLSFRSCGERVGQALYVPGPNACNVEYEYWEVNLCFEVGSQEVEYVVKYESFYGVYWANNSGMNFKLHKSCPLHTGFEVDAASACNAVPSVAETTAATELDPAPMVELADADLGMDKATHNVCYQEVLHELIDAKPKLNEVDLDFVLWLRHADL